MQSHGGGASETLHENAFAPSWQDPTLLETTLEILNAGPAVKTNPVMMSVPVFWTRSLYCPPPSGSSLTSAFVSVGAAAADTESRSASTASAANTAERLMLVG